MFPKKCIFQKNNFKKMYFPKVYFLKVCFLKVYFPKPYLPKPYFFESIFFKTLFQKVYFWKCTLWKLFRDFASLFLFSMFALDNSFWSSYNGVNSKSCSFWIDTVSLQNRNFAQQISICVVWTKNLFARLSISIWKSSQLLGMQ